MQIDKNLLIIYVKNAISSIINITTKPKKTSKH